MSQEIINAFNIALNDLRTWKPDTVEQAIGFIEIFRNRYVKALVRHAPADVGEYRITYEYCQSGLLGTLHEEWDSFSVVVSNKDLFIAEITDSMHRNIRVQSRPTWSDEVPA